MVFMLKGHIPSTIMLLNLSNYLNLFRSSSLFLLDHLVPTFVLHVELRNEGDLPPRMKGLRPGHLTYARKPCQGTFAFSGVGRIFVCRIG